MKPVCIGFVVLLLGGCAQPSRRVSSQAAAPAISVGTHSLDQFRFDWPRTTVQDVVAKVGKPDRDVGSGIRVLEYRLRDGSRVWVGSSDNSQIMYVTHGISASRSGPIYERP